MFNQVTILSYGRCVRHKNNWNLNSPYAVNRIYYIHSGEVIHGTHKPHLLKQGNLYLLSQNNKFELVLDSNTLVDHTFIDFITTPPISLDEVYELPFSEASLIQFTGKALINLIDSYPMHPSFTRPESYNTVKSYLKTFLKCINQEQALIRHADPAISKTLEYIHKNFCTDISIKRLADEINYEESVFIKRFKQAMGITPYQYIKNYRLATALNMLRNNTHSVSQIAEIAGYSNISGFSHAFKQVYGVYPSEIHKKDL